MKAYVKEEKTDFITYMENDDERGIGSNGH
jgi:hypothetical protein